MSAHRPTHRRVIGMLALLASAGLLVGQPTLARADEPRAAHARELYEKGEKLFALGRFSEALVEYQQAFDATPLPGFLFNIGQCYRNLGDTEAAIFSYKKYLTLDPAASNRAAVEELLGELQDKLDREHAAKLLQPPRMTPGGARRTPLYHRWWFWTGLGVLAVGAGLGTDVLLRDDTPATDLGNLDFHR